MAGFKWVSLTIAAWASAILLVGGNDMNAQTARHNRPKIVNVEKIARVEGVKAGRQPASSLSSKNRAIRHAKQRKNAAGAQQGPAPPPTLDSLANVPSQSLAAGFLAVDETIAWIKIAVEVGFDLTTSLDGPPKKINKANADIFLKAYRARLEIYRQAIMQRGFSTLIGYYRLQAEASCRGQEVDLREIFASREDDKGKPLMANELEVRQTGFRVELVLTRITDGQKQEIVFPGVTVKESAVFEVPNLGFYLWGIVRPKIIELHVDVSEMKRALGESVAPSADWKTFAACKFVLSQN